MNLNKNFYQIKKSIFNLYKLHGSITWRLLKDNNLLIESGIEDKPDFSEFSCYPHIIYPSLEKYNMALNYEHYYELLKKFKDVLFKENSCLLILGFSLKDVHIWNIISSALSNGKISIFIFTSEIILDNVNNLNEEKIKNHFREEVNSLNGINFVCVENYDFFNFFKSDESINLKSESDNPYIINLINEEKIEKS